MEKFNDKIQDYVDNMLPDTERQAFESEMTTDTQLAQEVRLFQDLIKGMDVATDTDLRKTIGSVQQRLALENFFDEEISTEVVVEKPQKEAIIRSLNVEKTATIRRMSTYQWAAAASVLLLIAIGLWLLQPNKKDSLFNETYTAYFQSETKKLNDVYTEITTPSFATDKVRNESLKGALDAYQAKNYGAAETQFQAHLLNFPNDMDAQFYMAQTFMNLNNTQNAVALLENLLKNAPNRWEKDAKWYLALNYLTMKEKRESALDSLREIRQTPTSPYQAKAADMLKKLNHELTN